MPTSQQLFEEYQKLINQTPQLQPLNPVQNEGDIYSNLMRRADNFAPQYNELSRLETQAFATPQTEYQRFDRDYGNGVGKGLGMGSETNSMMQTIGGRYGTADAYRRGLESQRLSLSDLARTLAEEEATKRETDIYNQGIIRQNWQDKASGASDLYQLALAREATGRAGSGGGGFLGGGLVDPNSNNTSTPTASTLPMTSQQLTSEYNRYVAEAIQAGQQPMQSFEYLWLTKHIDDYLKHQQDAYMAGQIPLTQEEYVQFAKQNGGF